MKKKKLLRGLVLLMLLVTGMAICGCTGGDNGAEGLGADNGSTGPGSDNKSYGVDYSSCSDFADIQWTRETEADTEYISFSSDGGFSYYCACGNSVNDSDLCDGYTYDEDTKTIKLEASEKTDSMVTEIKIINCDEDSIELDFGGDVRSFVRVD